MIDSILQATCGFRCKNLVFRTTRHIYQKDYRGSWSVKSGWYHEVHQYTNMQINFEIGSHDEGISTSSVSPNGRYIVSVMDNGSLNLYSVQALTHEINKPPLPLVKVVKDFPKDKTSIDQSSVTKISMTSGKAQRPLKSKKGNIQTRVLKPALTSVLEDKENVLPDGLNKKRLQDLLLGFGEYPAKYRMFIWRSLLQLPENHVAFSNLTDKGTHGAFLHLHEEYPIKSMKLLRVLQRILSALAHWSAIFSEAQYLPLLTFPFVKLFQNNRLICFEVVATVIVNWCQHWFDYFPNPPINILSMVENVLVHHDKELLLHFENHGITSQIFVWPLLETLFSEVLTREEWLKLFDNVFSNHPSFFLMTTAAYAICSRAPLLLCDQKDDFEYFFHHRNTLDINTIIKEAYHLMEATPADIHPRHLLEDFMPLTKGQYPIFNKYPKFIVDFQNREREKIRQEELEYLRERQLAHEMEAEAQKRKAEDEAWYQEQNLLQEAETQRRKILQEEERKLIEQRQRLTSVKRDLRLKELELLDKARRRFLNHQQNQQKMELRRMDDEIERKMYMRNEETVAIMQDLEVRQMELEAQKMFFEQQLAKDQENMTQEIKAELDSNHRKDDLEDKMFWNLMGRKRDEDLQAQKWTDAKERRAELETEKHGAAICNVYRKKILDDKMVDAEELQDLEKTVSSLNTLDCLEDRSEVQQQTKNVCLNDASSSNCSTHFSLDRRRGDLDCKERALMAEVRDLRQKLASQALNRSHAVSFSNTAWT